MNKRLRPSRRSALLACGLLLAMVAVPCMLTWRAWRQERVDRELIVAVKQGKVQQALSLLEEGANPNRQDVLEDTRSWFARMRDVLLHRQIASSSAPTALQLALLPYENPQGKRLPEDTRLLAALLQYGANPNIRDMDKDTPLLAMLEEDRRQAARLLVEHGADVNAVQGEKIDWTPLTWAAYNGDVSTLKLMLDKGALVDPPGRPYGTPLTTASEGKIVELLLKRGASVQSRRYDWRYEGTSPLIWAAFCDNEEGVELLLQRHANINDTDAEGRSALSRACQTGNLKIITQLVRCGARVNVQDRKRETPLMQAAHCEHIQAVRLLLAHGATVNNVNSQGSTALSHAQKSGNKQIIHLLRHAGAKE